MNRHLRNFLYFALGFAVMLLAGFASAANIKLSGPNSIAPNSGGGYSRGSGPTTTYTKSSTPLGAEALSSERALVKRVVDVSGSTGMGSWGGQVIDAMEVPRGSFASAMKDAAKRGLKPGGIVGALVLGLAADWMMQKGFQWLDDAQKWVKDGTITYPGTWYFSPNDKRGDASSMTAWVCQAYASRSDCTAFYYDSSQNYLCVTYPGYPPIDKGCWKMFVKESNSTPTPPKVDVSGVELDQSMDDLSTQKLKEVADAFLRDQSTIPIPDGNPASATGGPFNTPEKHMSDSTTQNPDGSQQVQSVDSHDTINIRGGDTINAPVTTNVSNVTRTTVNNITNNNTTTNTTTTTTTTPGTGPSVQEKPADQKTDCDKFPNSVGCADLGTPPGDPNLGQQVVNPTFSWSPFSLPSQCPAPMTISTSRRSYSLSWQPECDFATKIAPLVIAFAGLAALYIAFGMKNDG